MFEKLCVLQDKYRTQYDTASVADRHIQVPGTELKDLSTLPVAASVTGSSGPRTLQCQPRHHPHMLDDDALRMA